MHRAENELQRTARQLYPRMKEEIVQQPVLLDFVEISSPASDTGLDP
jgi:hypothetical protein